MDENRGVVESHATMGMKVRIHVPAQGGDSIIGDISATTHHDDHAAPL